jgi:SAM-dependent methyltransferase
MTIILRPNATPVYAFLSLINASKEGNTLLGKKILDCGAGGALPPLVLFRQHEFDTWGIDISEEQIQKAKAFCNEQGLLLHLHKGDARHIPFEDETFDYVYEHYSICHLSKNDSTRAIHEMYRVLKKGSLCFLGVISMDTWPKSGFGEEREPGQFLGKENGDELTLHSMFTDEEADRLVSDWEIISKEKRVLYARDEAQKTSFDTWMELHREVRNKYRPEAWEAKYTQRVNEFQYTHIYYYLKKPA